MGDHTLVHEWASGRKVDLTETGFLPFAYNAQTLDLSAKGRPTASLSRKEGLRRCPCGRHRYLFEPPLRTRVGGYNLPVLDLCQPHLQNVYTG